MTSQNIYQDDAYLIERVNAGMGEWEYVILYCGEYYAAAPTEEIALNIVEMAQHTCPCCTPQHDATIRNQMLGEILQKFSDIVLNGDCPYKYNCRDETHCEICQLKFVIESLRSTEAQK